VRGFFGIEVDSLHKKSSAGDATVRSSEFLGAGLGQNVNPTQYCSKMRELEVATVAASNFGKESQRKPLQMPKIGDFGLLTLGIP
jgi:hypothetical protein